LPDRFSVQMVMEKDVLTGSPGMSAREAAEAMAARRTGSLVVVDGDKPVGIFTERDLLQTVVKKDLDPGSIPISRVMTNKIVSISVDNTLEDAHQAMLRGDFRHLLVTKNGGVEGIISIKDLVRMREQVLEQRVREKTRELRKAQGQLVESLAVIQREMKSASKFQKYLINRRFPSVKNMRFSHVYEQASSLGGDFFEVARIDRTHIAILVADVMGHGITSAMIAIELKMYFDQVYPRHLAPAPVISRLNKQLIPLMPAAFFVAGFYGIVDTRSLEIEYTQFGLPKPVILRAGSHRITSLPHGNLPLGIKKDTKYTSRKARARPGDSLLLFTDGCIEQKDPKGRFFGEKRLINKFKDYMRDGRNRVPQRLFKTIADFAEDESISDDVTILLCEFLDEKQS